MDLAQKARAAAPALASATTAQKNAALIKLERYLVEKKDFLDKANRIDREAAAKEVAAGNLEDCIDQRIDCTGPHFGEMIQGIEDVINLEEPVGLCTLARQVSVDLNLYRVTCPIGVVLVIFEARPDACVQMISLAIKSGNCVILKGGKEAVNSLKALKTIVDEVIKETDGVPEGAVQFVDTREQVSELLKLDEKIDLVVPRGSNDLVRYIKDNTTIPVLGHADGICLTYVDKDADLDMALRLVEDGKLNYPAACNALETLLVHKEVAAKFLPQLDQSLASKVKYRADEQSISMLPPKSTTAATEKDWRTEFGSPTMAVKVVDDAEAAILHINTYGSGHTDVIVTNNAATADRFVTAVDSAGVFVNASSRFADGFRYGFGAEVGISTNRVHARGPVGLEGLVTYKYRLYGKGQCVGQFSPATPEAERLHYTQKDIPITEVKDASAIRADQENRRAAQTG